MVDGKRHVRISSYGFDDHRIRLHNAMQLIAIAHDVTGLDGERAQLVASTAEAKGKIAELELDLSYRQMGKPLWNWGSFASAAKTGRVVLVQEAPRTCGYAAELAAILAEKALLDLQAPILRVTGYDVPYPYWTIEDAYMPSVARVVDAARTLLDF